MLLVHRRRIIPKLISIPYHVDWTIRTKRLQKSSWYRKFGVSYEEIGTGDYSAGGLLSKGGATRIIAEGWGRGGGGRGGRRKCLLPVPIHSSLCPCLRVSPVQPGTTTPPSEPSSVTPCQQRCCHYRCRVPPCPESTPVSPHYPWRSGASGSHSAGCRAYTYIHVQIYTRRGLVGRVVPSTRHEALEKRRCPRMYFLIIDFNDEGSRCQRHLGCWAE